MRATADILRDREVGGLTLLIGLQIVGLVLLGIGIMLFVDRSEPFRIFLVGIPIIGALVGLLVMVRRRYRMALAGHLAILVSFLATGPILFLEWENAGIDVYAAAYLAKTGYPIGLVLVALTGLTLQPHYPATVTALLVVFNLVLLGVALDDPRTVLAQSSTWEEHVMGSALHLGKFANTVAFVVATGAVVTLATWIARRTVISAVSLEKANGQLRRYFSPDIADQVATADPEFLKPGGSIRPVVVLTSDITGFTRLSNDAGPDATLRTLADYQRRMTDAIFENGGSVDKFIGDGILATFGATGSLPDPCLRAVKTARGMTRALDQLNVERASRGEPRIAHRIGLHVGDAMVGNVGTEDRLEFTVIGDVVNVATRIESACKQTGDPVLLSSEVVAACPDLDVVSRGRLPLAGVDNAPELFALVQPDNPAP